ncbi:TraR/DksA C4-type zinc finger protein [Lewinella sp. 4G2]|uniref:TraR/DksA family transcriptional regulator n=1 Tax=Lewinella sp. 4G2 TaxID=1803372 RepID=UPI0007B4F2D4|nr:TraR/DksA C4-type zinc finger protein [Lewinella sp. 4G2]OAV43098.1 molecular chaperone DnaK [Lewinella sp. 4G2]
MNAAEQSRYSDADLAEFKLIIDEKLTEARKQLAFYLNQLSEQTNSEDGKKRGIDNGNHASMADDLQNQANRQRKLVQHLEYAGMRIENKVYGICRVTGKLISKERLRLVPHTTLSIAAKQAR